MHHKPCALLGDVQVSSNLVGANTVLAIADQPDSGQPLGHRQGRVLEYRSDLNAKLTAGMLLAALPAPREVGFSEESILWRNLRGCIARSFLAGDQSCASLWVWLDEMASRAAIRAINRASRSNGDMRSDGAARSSPQRCDGSTKSST